MSAPLHAYQIDAINIARLTDLQRGRKVDLTAPKAAEFQRWLERKLAGKSFVLRRETIGERNIFTLHMMKGAENDTHRAHQ